MPNSYFIPERKTLEGKKLFFVSDAHLGLPNYIESLKREKLLIKWLDEIKNDASEIFLLGDIFDFWYEWKRVVPRGFVRLLAKIAELTDSGIPVHLFTGNHDIWVFDYLPHETGVILHTTPFSLEVAGKKIHIAHGDALGPGDYVFKFLKKLFTNKLLQWFFSRFHPNFAIGLAYAWSRTNRWAHPIPQFLGDDKEWLVHYSKEVLRKYDFDFFVYGHRHVAIKKNITEKSTIILNGDWLQQFTFSVFDGVDFELKYFNRS